ncbi:GIN domain-containing protein [Pedobacter jamesrossensis]|uniref:GIN domain-containing protein n=1 Tax=Pedobacter jamesrossensis TaxID=1908238 RepID=A0ABV8NS98_9SPHI
MKNSIKNLFAAALVMVTLSGATLAANATENNSSYTALTQVKNITKIAVSGNVKLIIVQDAKESIEVFDKYYSNNALVQQQGSELRISSFTKDALTVIAHINNLTSIEASNTSSVTTSGKFNLLNLDVILKDKASANINANTINLNTIANDGTILNLEGTTESHTATLGNEAKMNMGDFASANTNISIMPKAIYANNLSRYEDLKIDLLEKLF